MSSPESASDISNPECLSRDEIEDVGIMFDATVLVTSSNSREAFHIPRSGTEDLEPICPSKTNKSEWKEKTAGQLTPTYEKCSRCAQYLGVHGTGIALEPEMIDLDGEGVIPLDR